MKTGLFPVEGEVITGVIVQLTSLPLPESKTSFMVQNIAVSGSGNHSTSNRMVRIH